MKHMQHGYAYVKAVKAVKAGGLVLTTLANAALLMLKRALPTGHHREPGLSTVSKVSLCVDRECTFFSMKAHLHVTTSPLLQNTAVLSSAILITLLGMMLHIHLVKVDHESLLVIGSMGVQMSSSYASGRETTTFIERSKIKDIVINEAIYMHSIIYYLCILLKEPSGPDAVARVVPLFQSSKPRLNCLVKVYKSCQEILSKC